MYIAVIAVEFDFNPKEPEVFVIATEESDNKMLEINTEVILMNTPLADGAMQAFSQNKTSFTCNGQTVRMHSFYPLNGYDDHCPYPRAGAEHVIDPQPDTLPVYLYKTTCHCYSCRRKYGFDDIHTVKAKVRTVSGTFRSIDVEYCKTCKHHPEGIYPHIVVDEAQDFSTNAYRLLRAMAGPQHQNDLFIVGDAHQRIYNRRTTLSKTKFQGQKQ